MIEAIQPEIRFVFMAIAVILLFRFAIYPSRKTERPSAHEDGRPYGENSTSEPVGAACESGRAANGRWPSE